ncbi:putative benzoate 4-monooxygenase cytochrome p450 protein [Eutypa lata UCREL1]|uniref:Putative benzoate 4-monooxygenase cytochrome p450 protein n=1 Tax=Eutypa lata (strain UCR-EL1) TaxID=1287681 RepID=M7T2G0_EUTLA|nr:putative benzoate 4-monooxygenase cytochrome p450 protein [Eutypa lata UCREL1]
MGWMSKYDIPEFLALEMNKARVGTKDRWTNLWRFATVRTGSYHIHIKNVHDKYGPVVRIGPNLLDLDVATPELPKMTEFYQNNSAVINGKITYQVFSETDPSSHARMKRPIAKFFSQGNVLAKEPLMNAIIGEMCQHLETRYKDSTCDLGEWIAFCAWDILGMVAFSQKFGYMDTGRDFDGSIATADKSLDYFAAVGQMPFLDYLLDKNPVFRIGPPNLGNITRIATERMVARLQGQRPPRPLEYGEDIPDYLDHFIAVKDAHPDAITETDIVVYLLTTLIAGADTTAITIRAIFYYALRKPSVYSRLEEEILSADLKSSAASYSSARALPLREGMRMHPAVCMLLERYVPQPGLTLPNSNQYIPAGTAVGMNPYVMGRNQSIWGADADEFRPERWLRHDGEDEVSYRERLQLYHAFDLTFGGGARICLGRYLAQAEVYKVVASLVRNFEIELVDPLREWEVVGSWFLRQKGLVCNLRERS